VSEVGEFFRKELEEYALKVASTRDLIYWSRYPEAGIVLYVVDFEFAVLVRSKIAGKSELQWLFVTVRVVSPTVDPYEALAEAKLYIEETYDPVDYFLISANIVTVVRVNPVFHIVEYFPERYWAPTWNILRTLSEWVETGVWPFLPYP